MKTYAGIDLHSTNNFIGIINQKDKRLYSHRHRNNLAEVLKVLRKYTKTLQGVVVESTYNWYWLVDGLMDNGYKVHLANPAAIQQYNGLKFKDDNRKNGNRYLAWAYVEAANFNKRYCEKAQKFVQRKTAKTNYSLAIEALGNKLSKASFFIMRDQVSYDSAMLFG